MKSLLIEALTFVSSNVVNPIIATNRILSLILFHMTVHLLGNLAYWSNTKITLDLNHVRFDPLIPGSLV